MLTPRRSSSVFFLRLETESKRTTVRKVSRRLIKHLWGGLRLRGGETSVLMPGVRSKRCRPA